MAANIITLGRILLAFVALLLFHGGLLLRASAVLLTILVIYLDSLDGIVARKLGLASDFGALFDITGDRIVEHIYWILFTAMGLVSLWVPIIIISRSFLVDSLRTLAYAREGKTPFGKKSMMRSSFSYFLTASRFSRGLYGGSKVTAFVLLGVVTLLPQAMNSYPAIFTPNVSDILKFVTNVVVWVVVVMNLIRGIPVLLDGRHYLFEKQFPRELKSES